MMLEKTKGLRPRQQHRATIWSTEDGDSKQNKPLSSAAKSYAEQITATWQKAVHSIIDTGRLLIQAKKDFRGEFQTMIKAMPFGPRTAQRLMAIADHPVLSNPTHVSHLPASWGTLYRMTEVPEDELERMLANGKINADTERHDVDVIIQQIKEAGMYNYDKLRASLNLLIAFMHNYQKLDDLGPVLNAAAQLHERVDLAELSKLPAWIKELHAACERNQAEVSRYYKEQFGVSSDDA
jgi:hypothetical protein